MSNKKKKIPTLRAKIDRLDRKIMKLCQARIELANQILEVKRNEKQKLYSKTRESEILNNYKLYLLQNSSKKKIKAFVNSLLALNKNY